MSSVAPFVFVVCQQGAEQPIKQSALADDQWRLAFSRPGLLTLKRASDDSATDWLSGPLVRLSGTGLGSVRSELAHECFEKTWELATKSHEATDQPRASKSAEAASAPAVGHSPVAEAHSSPATESNSTSQAVALETPVGSPWDAIHIFERDRTLPGHYSFEPGRSELVASLANEFSKWLEDRGVSLPLNRPALPGQRVLDVIVSEPNQWFVGHHVVRAVHEQWPGGVPPIVAPPEMISRAYLKIAEALMWSRLPIGSGDRIVEIGSAPGGASQRLLDLGYEVTGIDAAEMDERIVEHPRFEHWRSKAAAVKRRLYRKFKWLVCDANVAPNYTLDIISDIVHCEGNNIQGMILTFKMSSWDQLEHLPEQLDAIRQMGYRRVVARQLAHNRRELCVIAER